MKSKLKEKPTQFLKEFKEFAVKGNIIDMAVGVIIGGAFGKIVSSLVNDIITPLLSVFSRNINLANMFYALDGNQYNTLEEAKAAGAAVISYGMFITSIIDFLIISVSIFLFVRQIAAIRNKFKKVEPPVPETPVLVKECPFCKSSINIEAVKCPFCTSDLPENENEQAESDKSGETEKT
jgi:large conductance mechanosensitive channel